MGGALSSRRSIAVSFGHFMKNPPTLDGREEAPALTTEELIQARALAIKHTTSLVRQLWDNWEDDADTLTYSINVPLCETLQDPVVCWAKLWSSRFVVLACDSLTAQTQPALPRADRSAPWARGQGTLRDGRGPRGRQATGHAVLELRAGPQQSYAPSARRSARAGHGRVGRVQRAHQHLSCVRDICRAGRSVTSTATVPHVGST